MKISKEAPAAVLPLCRGSIMTPPTSTPTAPGPFCAVHPEVPATAACPRCGNFVCAGCWVRIPGQADLCPACAARTPHELLPWDLRRELGLVRGFGQTLWQVLRRPRSTFASATPSGSVASSLAFGALCACLAAVPRLLYHWVWGGPTDIARAWSPCVAVTWPFLWTLVLLIVATVDHAAIYLFGGRPRWSATLRGASLSMATAVLCIIPFVGILVSFAAWILYRVFAYQGLHQMSGGRAAGSVLASATLSGGCPLVFFVALYEFFSRAPP
jgi:hypothetical protein